MTFVCMTAFRSKTEAHIFLLTANDCLLKMIVKIQKFCCYDVTSYLPAFLSLSCEGSPFMP